MRPLAFAFTLGFGLAFAMSCAPEPTPSRKQTQALDIGPAALVHAFRGQIGERAYTDRRVRVYLASEGYEVSGWELHFRVTPQTEPAIVFHLRSPVADNRSAVFVEGICTGITRDGKRRTYPVNYCVTVTDCSVTPDP